MRTEPLSTKLTEEENAALLAIQAEMPMVKRSSVALLLTLLGARAYYLGKAEGVKFDPAVLLVEVQKLQAKQEKKDQRKL